MVKCRTFIRSGYIPTWRSVCEKWIQEALEEKEGEVTPVYVLYNAYLKDNPQQYLDIAQFGKILKSRFQNRKCRRGKQGAQIYVYKNVIIKTKAASMVSQETKKGYKPKAKSSDHFSSMDYKLFNGIQSIADSLGQSGITPESSSSKMLLPVDFSSIKNGSFNNQQSVPGHHGQLPMTPRLHTEASSANVSSEATSPLDLRLPAAVARRKLLLSTNPYEYSNYENINNHKKSKIDVLGVLEVQHQNKEEDDRSVCSSLSELSSLAKESSDGNSENDENPHDIADKDHDFMTVFTDNHSTALGSKDNMEYVFCNRDLSSPQKSMLLDVEVRDIEVEEESCLYLDYDQANTNAISEKYFKDKLQRKTSDRHSNVKVTEDHFVARPEGGEVKGIAATDLNEGPAQEETRSTPRSSEGQTVTKVETLNRKTIETNRMALGRRWVDHNLRDRPGKRTFPWEIAAAYARDRPEEPLTDTNFAVLIRSKFPSRRKKITSGPRTIYYYQDLELTNPSQLVDNSSVLRETTQDGQNLTPNAPAILMSGDDGAPVAVLNPPAESVFTMNGKPYVSLKIMVSPSSTSSAGDPSNSKGQKTLSYEAVANCKTKNEGSEEGIVNHPHNARVFESSCGSPDKSNDGMLITDQSLTEGGDIGCAEHPGRDQSQSGDDGMFSKSIASLERSVRDQSLAGNDGMFSDGTVPPKHPMEDVTSSAICQNLVDTIKAEPIDAETDLLITVEPSDVNTNPTVTKMDMAVSDYLHKEMLSEEICSYVHDEGCIKSRTSEDQGSQETDSPKKEGNINSLTKQVADFTSKSLEHKEKSDVRNLSSDSIHKEINKSVVKFQNLFSLERKLSRSSESRKSRKRDRLIQTFDAKGKRPRPNDHQANKRPNLDRYKRLSGHATQSSSIRKMVVLEHRKRKAKRWKAVEQNSLRIREVLQVAFHFFSAGSRLSGDERARRLEATIYGNNPAVSYREPSSPSSETNNYACRTSSHFIESTKSLTYSQVTSLLRHHQTCQGLGCSYSSNLCLTLRAMYSHITIFSHRCQVWEHFTDLVGLHTKSCHQWDCQLAFCLYVKHDTHLSGTSVRSDYEEGDLLRKEFDRCESHGPHGARLYCGHLPRIQIPLCGEVDSVSMKATECHYRDGVEARTLRLLGNFALPGSSPSFVTPIINTLCVTADMLKDYSSEAD
ncbi:uncharacterized protein LOC119587725 isoform X3 [Penaeus monodon]|uniref:uncharacterized protein LOC119587725 isoform X3 n=1 Tax=Penaeus monodon TaxID=6687 RepID=UPI0018A783D4|nr:uncharacterized protein LOC119587725 isoform X3 [Penaeus monodon]